MGLDFLSTEKKREVEVIVGSTTLKLRSLARIVFHVDNPTRKMDILKNFSLARSARSQISLAQTFALDWRKPESPLQGFRLTARRPKRRGAVPFGTVMVMVSVPDCGVFG